MQNGNEIQDTVYPRVEPLKPLIFRESARDANGNPIHNRRTFAVILPDRACLLPGIGRVQTLIIVGISRCSSADQFCKQRGCEIAIGRACKAFRQSKSKIITEDIVLPTRGWIWVNGSSLQKVFALSVKHKLENLYSFRYTPPASKVAPVDYQFAHRNSSTGEETPPSPQSISVNIPVAVPCEAPPVVHPAQTADGGTALTDDDIPF